MTETIQRIWVDADASPKAVKEILYRASERTKIPVTFVANQFLEVPRSSLIFAVKVASGFDVADNYIVEHSNKGDIAITQDIPLAAELVAKGCVVLNPRGERYTKENVRERLNMRDFMDSLRSSGVQTGGPEAFSKKDRMTFANALDNVLVQR
ncbi:MAG: YaiI/YqxD family protein [Arenicellales bacterium]